MRVVVVCLGNICRSPTAEGILRHLLRVAGRTDISVDSAGTGRWHVGEPPDPRAVATARRRGVTLTHLGRQFTRSDFAHYDLVLAVDQPVRRTLAAMAPDDEARQRIRLLRAFDPEAGPDAEVPDPYYGDDRGFDEVFTICEAAGRGLLAAYPPAADRPT